MMWLSLVCLGVTGVATPEVAQPARSVAWVRALSQAPRCRPARKLWICTPQSSGRISAAMNKRPRGSTTKRFCLT